MLSARGYAAHNPSDPLVPFTFERRQPGAHDVLIEIDYCGICHSDIHQVRNEWGGSLYPMVPGHEIVGHVVGLGEAVTRFKPGETVGVGCFVDSCRNCSSCLTGLEQFCENHLTLTYNSYEADLKTLHHGGYSDRIVVDEHYVLHVPDNLDLAATAPLLCAGITTYAPLRQWGVGSGHRVGVLGLGGLGHMAVKFARSFGAEVTVFSRSHAKEADAHRLGAHHFVAASDSNSPHLNRHFDFIVDTISAPHSPGPWLELLRVDGTMILVGAPPQAMALEAFKLIQCRRRLVGSLIGGIRESQMMLDYCGQYDIASDIELIPVNRVNQAYERTLMGDVRFRFVLDVKSWRS